VSKTGKRGSNRKKKKKKKKRTEKDGETGQGPRKRKEFAPAAGDERKGNREYKERNKRQKPKASGGKTATP